MSGDQLLDLVENYKRYDPDDLANDLKAFRISKRRAKMLPATCFLVSAMLKVIPVDKVYFSEGGVRQGFCYHLLSPLEREKDPLLEGIHDYMEHMRYKLPAKEYQSVMGVIKNAIPSEYLDPQHPFQLGRLVPAALLLANMTSHYPKETRAYVAFHMPLASGPLANVAGLLHSERAILALLLAYRQGGEIPDNLLQVMESRVGKEAVSICKYIGKLMEFIFMLSPRLPSLGLVTTGIQFYLKKSQVPTSMYLLHVILPQKQENSLVDAPGVMALVKSMNKKIQIKKWNHSEDAYAMFKSNHYLDGTRLFSVEIKQE
jgi:retrograde regulation protein 2